MLQSRFDASAHREKTFEPKDGTPLQKKMPEVCANHGLTSVTPSCHSSKWQAYAAAEGPFRLLACLVFGQRAGGPNPSLHPEFSPHGGMERHRCDAWTPSGPGCELSRSCYPTCSPSLDCAPGRISISVRDSIYTLCLWHLDNAESA